MGAISGMAQVNVRVDRQVKAIAPESPFAASWAAADQLYADLGIVASPGSDDRDWDTVYAEAMDEHYRQKGMIL